MAEGVEKIKFGSKKKGRAHKNSGPKVKNTKSSRGQGN